MDSLTQIALGAAVGTAVLGRKVGPRAALWGAVCGTLPDLDVLLPYGDPVRDFTFHRAESHSLFWLTAVSPALALLIHRLHRRAGATLPRVAGTRLARAGHPPAARRDDGLRARSCCCRSRTTRSASAACSSSTRFTPVPLIVGILGWLWLRNRDPARAQRWNAAGLALSTLYLGWTVAAQAHVEGVVNRTLAASDLAEGRVLVTPSPFNSVLWRVVVMDDGAYHEGYYSLFDEQPTVRLTRHASEARLLEGVQDDWAVRRLAWFSKGFYGVQQAPPDARVANGSASTLGQMLGLVETAAADTVPQDGVTPIVMTDLRMGQTPWFVFAFVVAERDDDGVTAVPTQQVPTRRPPAAVLPMLWQRIWDEDVSVAAAERIHPAR